MIKSIDIDSNNGDHNSSASKERNIYIGVEDHSLKTLAERRVADRRKWGRRAIDKLGMNKLYTKTITVVIPALNEGKIVLCDRFIDSSLAYQGYARGIGVEEVYSINQFAIDSFMPHLTIIFNLDPEVGLKRITQNEAREQNRLDLEKLSFHKKVAEAYDMLASRFPNRIQLIDAHQSLERVQKQCLDIVHNFIKQ